MQRGRATKAASETLHARLRGLARREFLILAAVGAAGLVGALRWTGLGRLFADGEQPTKLGVLARLGEVWRAFGSYHQTGIGDYQALGDQMAGALQTLDDLTRRREIKAETAAALAAAFQQRYYDIRRLRATCYLGPPPGTLMSAQAMAAQTSILDRLVEEGKLTPEVEARARAAIAKAVTFQTRFRELQGQAEGGTRDAVQAARKAMAEVGAQYDAGTLEPAEGATEAAKMLVDFTVRRQPGDG